MSNKNKAITEEIRNNILNEQISLSIDLLKSLGRGVKEETALWQSIKTNVPEIAKNYKTVDEFLLALKDGKIPASEADAIIRNSISKVPELFAKMKGLFREEPKFIEIAHKVYPNGTIMPPNKTNMELVKKTLGRYGFADNEIESMLKSSIQKTPLEISKSVTTPSTKEAADLAKKTLGNRILELRKMIKNKSNWKTLVKWAAGLGLGSFVLWSFLSSSGEETPSDFPTTPPTDFPSCVQSLLDNGTGKSVITKNGQNSIFIQKTGVPEYDKAGGLYFYNNHRVMMGDRSKMGSWSCKGEKTQISEQIDSNLGSDVEKMIDLLDFPVSSQDMIDANNLLSKYATNGKGKEFLSAYQQSGLGGGSLKKSLKYIFVTSANSTQARNNMYKIIEQIENASSPKGGNAPSQGDETNDANISNINIVWDNGNGGGSKYKACIEFPFKKYCKNESIKEMQICLGFPVKYQTGNFGPITEKALTDAGFELSGGITREIYNAVKERCKTTETKPIENMTSKPAQSVARTSTQPEPNELTPRENGNEKTNKSPEYAYYKSLVNSGYLKYKDNKIKYTGPQLNERELNALQSYLSNNGYYMSKNDQRLIGNDWVYVWRPNK